jgi:ATP-binding cassette, subfamily B, bacterial
MRSLTSAVAFVVRDAVRTDPLRMLVGGVLLVLGYAATPFIALALRAVTNAALTGHTTRAVLAGAVVAVLLVGELTLGHFAHFSYFELGESQVVGLQREVGRLANGPAGLACHEDPGRADRLLLLRQETWRVREVLEAMLRSVGLAVQLAITSVLLALVDPYLLLLPLAAAAPLVAGRAAQRIAERARQATAQRTRLAGHLLRQGTSPAAAKEVRIYRLGGELARRYARERAETTRVLNRAGWRAALLRAAGQTVFAAAYGAALFEVLYRARGGRAGIGDVVLVIALATTVSSQVAAGVEVLQTLHGAGAMVDRLRALREPAEPERSEPGAAVPARLADGIVFEHVGFTYPGTDAPVLREVNLRIAAGSTVALVGENGAGKTSLVKLLCQFYQPTDGRVLVDGVPLAALPAQPWRERVAAVFQDFARLELRLRDDVGVGDVPRLADDAALRAALDGARAEDLPALVPGGLDGIVGTAYDDGTDLSGGQWQKLALARALLREAPLLVLLDEAGSALDARTEAELFERYLAAARGAARRTGAVTLFTSHRLSTVRTADAIIVLEAGRVVEYGPHEELIASGGRYAELFKLQAAAYS